MPRATRRTAIGRTLTIGARRRLTRQLSDEKARRARPEFARRHGDRGQLRRHQLREVDVVAADDRQLTGDRDSRHCARLECPQRREVIGAEDGGGTRPKREDRPHRLHPAGDGRRGAPKCLGGDRNSGLPELPSEPTLAQAECGGVDGRTDEGAAPVPKLEQVPRGKLAGHLRVAHDAGEVGELLIHQHDVHTGQRFGREPGRTDRIEDHAIDLSRLERIDTLLGVRFTGLAEEDRITRLAGHLLGAAHDGGEEGVGEIGDDDSQGE